MLMKSILVSLNYFTKSKDMTGFHKNVFQRFDPKTPNTPLLRPSLPKGGIRIFYNLI